MAIRIFDAVELEYPRIGPRAPARAAVFGAQLASGLELLPAARDARYMRKASICLPQRVNSPPIFAEPAGGRENNNKPS